MKNNYYRILAGWLLGMCVFLFVGCATAESTDATIADAEQALADNDVDHSRQICNSITSKGLEGLSEEQLGKLAILYMKFSDVTNSDEDIAEATQCIRQAWKVSTDSMNGFIGSLSPEDLPHFVMLMRIGGSIDSPPDLSEEHYSEDSVHLSAEHL